MQKGKNYLVGLNAPPTIEIKEGSWAQIRYQDDNKKSVAVTITLTTESWNGVTVVHIFALANGPDPQPVQDELVYKDKDGNNEARMIMSFDPLDK